MGRLWLPTGSKPHPFPSGERDELENRLWEARYLVPYAKALELSELRDLVQFAEGRNQERLNVEEAKVRAGAEIVSRLPREQVIGALKEFAAWRRRRTGK